MVSSFDEGTLVTSYVRILGSGTDTTAMPSMCDLSRVSTLVLLTQGKQDKKSQISYSSLVGIFHQLLLKKILILIL